MSNQNLLARRGAAVPRGISHACAISAARAQNAEVWDVEGRRYIDFAAGIAVLNVGHRHPKVMAAVEAQLSKFTHMSFQVAPYEGYVALCERLNAIAPFPGPAKTILLNSGAEAVENALKIARAATGRSAAIAFMGAFHGRTIATTSLTGKVKPYKAQFGPLLPDIYHAPFPVESAGMSAEASLASLKDVLRFQVDPERVAAIVIEPVQGEGGFHVAPRALMQGIRDLCDEHGILMIVDEVQSGFARTGRMFAIEHAGVAPDLVAVAKAMGGGFPLAGVIGRAAVMDHLPVGGLGSTFGGSPVSCAAAQATLDVIEEEGLIARATDIGQRLVKALDRLKAQSNRPVLRNVRGLGAMVAFDLMSEDGITPDPEGAKRMVAAALSKGLFLLTCGVDANSIRLLPPLTTPDAILDEGLAILSDALVQSGGAH